MVYTEPVQEGRTVLGNAQIVRIGDLEKSAVRSLASKSSWVEQ